MEKITQLDSPDILTPEGDLKDPYRGFIAKSKYNRWLEEEGRRETWVESVNRYVDWMVDYQKKRGVETPKDLVEDIRHAITYQHVMPSMRALMTAGPALEKNHIASFNCAFTAVDSVRAFDEALIILMHSTGLGYSVENKYINKLPEVAESFHKTTTVVKVEDSKEGWAKALKEWLALLWSGQIPTYDVSKVRPKGARLKTFGGQASGPQPLVDLFEFTKDLLINSSGRRITNLEAHDIMCKIAEVVVVGSVRRSALISLSDLGSRDLAEAKSGAWWVHNPQRAMANNSAVYTKRPNMETFFREWKTLYDSKSGERGIFNLDAIRKHVDKAGRRDSSLLAGVNPCLTGDSMLMTDTGWVSFYDAYLLEDPQNIMVDGRVSYSPSSDGKEHPENWKVNLAVKHAPTVMKASKVFLTQKDADIVKVTTSSGFEVRLTPDHLVATKKGMKEAGQLTPEDKILITRGAYPSQEASLPSTREEEDGFLMGLIAGDGTFSVGKITEIAHIDLWNEDREIATMLLEWITRRFSEYRDVYKSGGNRPFTPFSVTENAERAKLRISSSFLAAYLRGEYGFSKASKHVVPPLLVANATSAQARQYVSGLAFADGTVNKYNKVGSSSIRIAQSNRGMLQDVQRIALSNGMFAALYSRRPAGSMTVGGSSFATKENFELIFMASAYEFTKYIGFGPSRKQALAESMFTKPSRKQASYTTVVSVDADGIEDVYCLKEDERRILSANGITMRRCGEINLRDKEFCNLTEVILAGTDTKNEILEKIRIATILGTWQASLTDFKYLRKKWADNVREEALLGVSMTGIFGNQLMNGHEGLESLAQLLDEAREFSVVVNKEEAARIGINQAAAISCTKPSGSVSQLTGTSSGIHPWYAHKYARRVRGNNHDPLVRLMKDAGVPNEPELNKPLDTTVFTFPLQAPEGSVVGDDITAIEHLELWRTYRNHWTEHNPSVTITVREDEWLEVGAYVYKHFDEMSGVSFLPDAGNHTYQQAPFEKLDDEAFQALVDSSVPIPWDKLGIYELEDATTGTQELACVAGACEVVDLETTDSETVEFTEVPIIDLEEVK